jgi:hypothetical protein
MMNHEPSSMTLSDDERRLLGLWAADCAERVLTLFEAKAPSDTRPCEAIAGIRAFAHGGKLNTRSAMRLSLSIPFRYGSIGQRKHKTSVILAAYEASGPSNNHRRQDCLFGGRCAAVRPL